MSKRNGEKARAAIEKRRRTAQRLKDRTLRAAAAAGGAKPATPQAKSKE
jgi:hypothetical protein